MHARQRLGRTGEDLAVAYLVDDGWRVLDRNWFAADGELDVVGLDVAADAVVGVEVKTRRTATFGSPAEAVTRGKVHRMRRLLATWLAEHDVHAAEARLDVVAITLAPGAPPLLEHLRGVDR
ncbi:YraN family protein [Cellulomonas triticagri]|uniref:UPF0102 protein EBM89_07380 n=1 Tax=Cellulomonas triticagri TaxID=2483352 RepID=A0A3M2JKT6_9CELL|nr:YraN family protein [Cellulomonas triticagri]RMI12771.1 YraN family protein [Cellulomonas triticagri]